MANFIKLSDGSLLNLDCVCYVAKPSLRTYVFGRDAAVEITEEDFLKIENHLFRKQNFGKRGGAS